MIAHQTKIIGEGLTYDDVLLVPNFSSVLPREVNIQTKVTVLKTVVMAVDKILNNRRTKE